MPIPSGSQLSPPKNWDEFEELCADVFAEEWRDINTVRHARQGQRQNGVDIYGRPHSGGAAGVQCKGKRRWPPKLLTTTEIDTKIKRARSFVPPLTTFIIATTAENDGGLQKHARLVTEKHRQEGLFEVHVLGWEELCRRITTHESVLLKYYSYVGLTAIRERLGAIETATAMLPQRTASRVAQIIGREDLEDRRARDTSQAMKSAEHLKWRENNPIFKRLSAVSKRTANRTNVVQTGSVGPELTLGGDLYVTRDVENEILRSLEREDF